MSTIRMGAHLQNLGVVFTKRNDVWLALYAGEEAARDLQLGNCIWKAALALGEAK